MDEALDLEPIKEFRRIVMAQYRRDHDNGTIPEVVQVIEALIAEVERLRAAEVPV